MSHRHSSSGGDSRRHSSSSRRDQSPPRHRRGRSPSPGPSRPRREEPRDSKELPESFGRQESKSPDRDESNILQRMKTHYQSSPLSDLYDCIKSEKKVKIWTRNFKEVRGVMTGFLIAFDKHWNVVLKDVDEVYLKPKKSKTPFLREIAPNETFQEIPAKVPRQKKEAEAEGEGEEGEAEAAEAEKPKPKPKPAATAAEGGKKKKSRRKSAKSTSAKRQIPQLFVRGDNIVMVCPMEDDLIGEEEEEMEGEEAKEGGEDDKKD